MILDINGTFYFILSAQVVAMIHIFFFFFFYRSAVVVMGNVQNSYFSYEKTHVFFEVICVTCDTGAATILFNASLSSANRQRAHISFNSNFILFFFSLFSHLSLTLFSFFSLSLCVISCDFVVFHL